MRRPANMPEYCTFRDQRIDGRTTHSRRVRHSLFVLMALVCLTRYGDARADGDALAGEKFAIPGKPLHPDFDVGRIPDRLTTTASILPNPYQAPEPEHNESWPAEFGPRGHSEAEIETEVATSSNVPLLRSTTVWQRLEEFRAHGRVRLLTLWESGWSTVSLQAGKKGEPSLQWTSRSMNRGGATRGVLDRLFSVSAAGASRGLHPTPHTTTVDTSARTSKFADSIAAGTK